MALYDEPIKERIAHMLAKRGCKKTACKGKSTDIKRSIRYFAI